MTTTTTTIKSSSVKKHGHIGHWLPRGLASGLLGRRHEERGDKTALPCGLVVELSVHTLHTASDDLSITCPGCRDRLTEMESA